MKKLVGILALPVVLFLGSHQALAAADQGQIGIVNVTELFNSSEYVKTANKTLQDNAKKMDVTLKAAQAKLQQHANEYQAIKNETKKANMAKKISEEQSDLTKMAQDYQAKIQAEQNSGMQEFTKLVQAAVGKVAKEKNIRHVLNINSLVYSDDSWVDMTKDVAAEMSKKKSGE